MVGCWPITNRHACVTQAPWLEDMHANCTSYYHFAMLSAPHLAPKNILESSLGPNLRAAESDLKLTHIKKALWRAAPRLVPTAVDPTSRPYHLPHSVP